MLFDDLLRISEHLRHVARGHSRPTNHIHGERIAEHMWVSIWLADLGLYLGDPGVGEQRL